MVVPAAPHPVLRTQVFRALMPEIVGALTKAPNGAVSHSFSFFPIAFNLLLLKDTVLFSFLVLA